MPAPPPGAEPLRDERPRPVGCGSALVMIGLLLAGLAHTIGAVP
jgi:hypothetical protein